MKSNQNIIAAIILGIAIIAAAYIHQHYNTFNTCLRAWGALDLSREQALGVCSSR